MRRLGSMSAMAFGSALFWCGGMLFAQEPEPEFMSEAEPPGPAICAPRTDLYSTYSEAFANPDSVPCGMSGQEEMNGLFKGPRHFKWIFQQDTLRWGRTNGGNKVLTYTTANLDDRNGLGPAVNADPDNLPLFGVPIGNSPLVGGLIINETVNDRMNNGVFLPGEDPNSQGIFFPAQNFPGPIIANQIRTQTDDFDQGREYGFRPTIGIEFQDESRITFTYWWVSDFQSRLLEDVSGSAVNARVISDNDNPFFPEWQRFGYLSSDFITALPTFSGELRRQVGGDPSPIPHDPQKESPPLIPNPNTPTTSSDVPREPTVNDAARRGTLNGPEDQPVQSLLWQDGEVVIADFHNDIQGADLKFEKSLFEFFNPVWKIWGIAGVKYLALDEGFTFTFADIAPLGSIGDTGYQAYSPFDRFQANNVGLPPNLVNFKSQPSNEAVAIHRIDVDNDIIAPNLGIRAVRPVWNLFEIDMTGMGAFGPNFLHKDTSLVRGDGLVGFIRDRDEVATSAMFEVRLGMNFMPHPAVRLRAGWEALWLINVATASSNIVYNLDRNTRPNNEDEVLYYGWYFGGEIRF